MSPTARCKPMATAWLPPAMAPTPPTSRRSMPMRSTPMGTAMPRLPPSPMRKPYRVLTSSPARPDRTWCLPRSMEQTTGTSVSTSDNAVQALAYGNRSTGNRVAVDATNIDTSVDGCPASRFRIARHGDLGSDRSMPRSRRRTCRPVPVRSRPPCLRGTSIRLRRKSAPGIGDLGHRQFACQRLQRERCRSYGQPGDDVCRARRQRSSPPRQACRTSSSTSSDLNALIGVAGTSWIAGRSGYGSTAGFGQRWQRSLGTMSLSGDTLTVSRCARGRNLHRTIRSRLGRCGVPQRPCQRDRRHGGRFNSVTFAVGSCRYDGASTASSFDNGRRRIGLRRRAVHGGWFHHSGNCFRLRLIAATPNQGGVTIAIGDDVIETRRYRWPATATSGSVLGNGATNSLVASATDVSGGSGTCI